MLAALFDLDGTLHDRQEGLRRFATAQASRLCADTAIHHTFCSTFLKLDDNGRVWKDRVYDQLRETFESTRWPTTDYLVREYIQEFPGMSVAARGAKTMLRRLRGHGIRTAIVTNGRSDVQRAVIAALGFDALVDEIIVSDEVGFRKPQVEIFRTALDALGSRADEAVMVGDDPMTDLEGARAAGIQPLAYGCDVAWATSVGDMESVGNEVLRLLHPAN